MPMGSLGERTSTTLDRPLLSEADADPPVALSRKGLQRRATFRRAIVGVLAQAKAGRTAAMPKPSIDIAKEHVRFFLPKTATGALLPLKCSEAEFSAHVGAGVALYMRFVKLTGYMFAFATVIALPQFREVLPSSEDGRLREWFGMIS